MNKKSLRANSFPWINAMLIIGVVSSVLGCANHATNSAESDTTTPAASLSNSQLTFDKAPLTADQAVQIALINNQNLAEVYAELGFAKAEVFAGARIRNPLLSFSQLNSNTGIDQVTWGISGSLTDLVTLRSRKKLAAAQALAIEQKIQAYAMDTQALTYQHYYRYLASKQRLQVFQQISAISDLILETTQRYRDAGNITALELAEVKIEASEAKLELLDAQTALLLARTEMSEVLGVPASQNWQIAKQLSIPNKASLYPKDSSSRKIPERASLLQQASEQRLDLKAAQTKIATITFQLKSHNLENKVGDIELGVESESESDNERLAGPNIEWKVPAFSQGQEDQLQINAELEIAQAQLQQLTLELDNGIALALAGRENSANKIKQYQNHLLPAQANAVARSKEEQFFMLIGVFEVLQSKKQQYVSLLGYVDAVEEYWLCNTALAKAVGVSPKDFIDELNNDSLEFDDYLQSEKGANAFKKSHKHHHNVRESQPAPTTPKHSSNKHSTHNHASHQKHTKPASAKP